MPSSTPSIFLSLCERPLNDSLFPPILTKSNNPIVPGAIIIEKVIQKLSELETPKEVTTLNRVQPKPCKITRNIDGKPADQMQSKRGASFFACSPIRIFHLSLMLRFLMKNLFQI
jgi:hypothetical protein